MENREEKDLVLRAQAGDRQAFAGLVDRYWMRVYRWLYGLAGNATEAEDLAQDAFLKVWTTLPSLADAGSFRPWLFRIARNGLIDRQRAVRPTGPLGAAEAASSRDVGPLAEMLDREGQTMLKLACERLPEIHRAAFLLWTQEGLPYSEIAHVLGLTEETARWRVCKARHLIVKELGEYLDREPR